MMDTTFTWADGGVVAAQGFMAGAAAAGLKAKGRRDVAVVTSPEPVPAAAVFTQNTFAAPPVLVSREHITTGRARAVVINSGNANAATGERGMRDARTMASVTAELLGAASTDIVVASTGVIGVPLPIELVTAGISEAVGGLDNRDGSDVAHAIMTTDTFAKQTAVSVEVDGVKVTVGGMAKGSGMIQPNMATMLAVITTDAPLTADGCEVALRSATARTFNRISVDSDTSTNDMAVLMASGAAGGGPIGPGEPGFDIVSAAIHEVCGELARMIVRDGEGATKLVHVVVTGAGSEAEAEVAAFAVANSPLVKTAIFGQDANWGRVAMALGKCGVAFDPSDVEISFAGILTCRAGEAVPFDEDEAAAALAADEVTIECSLGMGDGEATVLTCDLSYEYVRINGEYRS